LQSQQTLPLAPGSRTTASHFSCFLFLHLPTRTNYHIHSSTSVITLIDTCLGDDCLCQHRLIPRKKISGKSQHYTAGSGERVTRVTLLTSLRKRGRDSTPSYSSGHVITTTSKIMRYMLFSARLIRSPPFRGNWIIMPAYADSFKAASSCFTAQSDVCGGIDKCQH
jgi:hypothetical protein